MPTGPYTPLRNFTTQEILTGNRNTKFRLDVLDANYNAVTTLDGVTSGSLDWLANASVKGGGALTVQDVSQSINWLNVRLRPVMTIKGLADQNLGVFFASEYPESWDNNRSWAVKLLDTTGLLDVDLITASYSVAAGTVITTEVINQLAASQITKYSVTPSTQTLTDAIVWDAGTSRLKIINDLLSIINYFALYANLDGQVIAEPYILPAKRPIVWEFLDDEKSIYEPGISVDHDTWSIPNRFTASTPGSGTTAALTSFYENNDPASPYSIPNRGVRGKSETSVEAADQATLDAYTRRRLVELTTPTQGVTARHAIVPGLMVNNAARFRRVPAGIDARHTVFETKINLIGDDLAETTFRQVVDL